ncbi:hypothetical protein NHX12_007234 [Muraenolepis orangiensis]|uniref:Leukocyte cell-derived chemotaxin 1 n=1 Tax=Muraenolepis orangiensis TaxID=630683 RepID=A0A9Q0IBD5_9TELE|nr:hypothetical protein NHX12_007234 [Muraenolepis orangiensis]
MTDLTSEKVQQSGCSFGPTHLQHSAAPQWKVSDKNVHNVHYNMRISGELQKGSMEGFSPGNGEGEAVEIHDFQIGITGLRFFRGEKCYIKPHIRAYPPDLGSYRERLTFDPSEEGVPARLDEDTVMWAAADRPMEDTRFLSPKILALCGDAPVYWLHPTYPKDGERRKRDTRRTKRQFDTEEFDAAGTASGGAAGQRTAPGSGPARDKSPGAVLVVGDEDGGDQTLGANPYHRKPEAGDARGDAATFDPMLDHLGVCCAECRRSYTHCQRVCEPLRGHWPWPYNYAGCRAVCRVILPCRWWVARVLGVV